VLDDPSVRLKHYLDVLARELDRPMAAPRVASKAICSCCCSD
jgi:hypothetical protein